MKLTLVLFLALAGAGCQFKTCSTWNVDPKVFGFPTQPTGTPVCKAR